jgi:uncharacterized protein (TIGR02271 family)
MISMDQARTLQGKKLLGQGGENLGTIDVLYADRDGNEPTFATVNTGMFGSKTSFVPLSAANLQGNEVVVPYDKELVKGAPSIEADSELSPEEEQRLYSHYGVTGGQSYDSGAGTESNVGTAGGTNARDTGTQATATQGHDTSGPTTDDAMTRSEERLQVGTQQVETGRARLRKFITTENVQTTVPVSREEVVVEREPITEANKGQALDGPDLSEEEHEVVLHADQPVVSKETVPVERVKLGTQQVTEQQQVNETVRKEQIETEGVEGDRPRQQ